MEILMDDGIDEFSAYYIVIPVDGNCVIVETILPREMRFTFN
jgi:hypothetical protein